MIKEGPNSIPEIIRQMTDLFKEVMVVLENLSEPCKSNGAGYMRILIGKDHKISGDILSVITGRPRSW